MQWEKVYNPNIDIRIKSSSDIVDQQQKLVVTYATSLQNTKKYLSEEIIIYTALSAAAFAAGPATLGFSLFFLLHFRLML